jgi:CubicO group peptidase (beta-lactamase class C family)
VSVDELLGRAQGLVDAGVTPACQLAVARDGALLAFETFGDAPESSRFCAFSTTKPIVASMVWLLLGDGGLAPDDRVADLIPEFATRGKGVVTVDQVLLHTAGFPNAALDPAAGADPEARRAAFARWDLEWEPGTRFEYHASSAHWVLVDLVERRTGLDFRDAIEQRVTAPLGLPRVLGLAPDDQDDVVDGIGVGASADAAELEELLAIANDPLVRAAGVPGGGGIMTAATMAGFYQALLRNPGGHWDAEVLADATTHVRCSFADPMMDVPVNRTRGLVLAGDDGLHQFRQAVFGAGCSPGAFGHGGAFLQVAWADPATGTSFAFFKNGYDLDMIGDAAHVVPLCDLAAALD